MKFLALITVAWALVPGTSDYVACTTLTGVWIPYIGGIMSAARCSSISQDEWNRELRQFLHGGVSGSGTAGCPPRNPSCKMWRSEQ